METELAVHKRSFFASLEKAGGGSYAVSSAANHFLSRRFGEEEDESIHL